VFHLIPAPLHRQLYRVADRVRRIWWRVRKPRRHSVNVIAFDDQGRVLLVRHSYGPPVWALPGGGIGRGEDPQVAARREFREELGCDIDGLAVIEAIDQEVSGSRDRMYLFAATIAGMPAPDMREIVELGYFEPDRLPGNVDRRIGERVRQALARRGTGAAS
jgi:8-oxo-dGTP pyrophosphatase MutT (NUDIX family)